MEFLSITTVLVKDIKPGPNNPGPASLANVNGTLFFTVDDADWQPRELWKSDGTAEGTLRVRYIDYPSQLTAVNGTLFFTAVDGVTGRYDQMLWMS